MTGRPTSYTITIADKICDEIAHGKSLVRICKEIKIDYKTVMRWLDKYEEFRQKYAQARDKQADFYADQIIEIADGKSPPDDRRIKVDARKWVASKLKPKKYGDKIQAEHSGVDGNPIETKSIVAVADLQGKSLDELTRLFTEKLKS